MTKNTAIEHITEVIGFLNKNADYAVLRNFEGLPENNNSRDIDIIITRQSYKSIKNILAAGTDNAEPAVPETTHNQHGITRGADYYRR